MVTSRDDVVGVGTPPSSFPEKDVWIASGHVAFQRSAHRMPIVT